MDQLLNPSDVKPIAWDALDADVRERFDGSIAHLRFTSREMRTEGTARGCYIIRFMRLLGTAFPAPGDHRASIVEVDVLSPGRRSWRRSYAGSCRDMRLDTVKTEADGMVEERSGPLIITLRPEIHHDHLVLRSTRFDIAIGAVRVRIPEMLIPGELVVEHRHVSDHSFEFDMRLKNRRLHEIFIHTGIFEDIRHQHEG